MGDEVEGAPDDPGHMATQLCLEISGVQGLYSTISRCPQSSEV